MTDRKDATLTPRNLLLGLGAFAGGVAALAVGALALGRRQDATGQGAFGQHDPAPQPAAAEPLAGPAPVEQPAPTGLEGHAAADLAADRPVDLHSHADPAFRPDVDAPMTPAEREALRPATGPAPSLVAPEGGSVQGPGGDKY